MYVPCASLNNHTQKCSAHTVWRHPYILPKKLFCVCTHIKRSKKRRNLPTESTFHHNYYSVSRSHTFFLTQWNLVLMDTKRNWGRKCTLFCCTTRRIGGGNSEREEEWEKEQMMLMYLLLFCIILLSFLYTCARCDNMKCYVSNGTMKLFYLHAFHFSCLFIFECQFNSMKTSFE